jgi:hypothetical protein
MTGARDLLTGASLSPELGALLHPNDDAVGGAARIQDGKPRAPLGIAGDPRRDRDRHREVEDGSIEVVLVAGRRSGGEAAPRWSTIPAVACAVARGRHAEFQGGQPDQDADTEIADPLLACRAAVSASRSRRQSAAASRGTQYRAPQDGERERRDHHSPIATATNAQTTAMMLKSRFIPPPRARRARPCGFAIFR